MTGDPQGAIEMPYNYDWNRHTTEDLYVYLGAYLKERRKKAGIDPATVAHQMNVTRATVHYMESGERRVAVHRLVAYCAVIGENPADVLFAVLTQIPDIG